MTIIEKPYIPTIAIDFDGVLHDYHLGWYDGTIYGSWIEGAREGLRRLMDDYCVFIFTSRDPEQVAGWLASWFEVTTELPKPNDRGAIFWSEQGKLLVTRVKLAAVAYIDDRAYRFTSWAETVNKFQVPSFITD